MVSRQLCNHLLIYIYALFATVGALDFLWRFLPKEPLNLLPFVVRESPLPISSSIFKIYKIVNYYQLYNQVLQIIQNRELIIS